VYETLAEVYRAKGNVDSFYHYNQLYTTLHDSIENVATLSSLKIAQLKIENENSLRAIDTLQRERRTEVLKRNFVIIAIILVSIILLMYIKRRRLKQSHKNEIAAAVRTEQNRLLEEIANQTILTEQDWNNFKRLFEKIYPGFFINLKQKAPDITLAEQRMAALTRLNISSRQMASMLGISVDSVHKTRQRLRQRLHIHGEESLEEAVGSL